VIYFYQFNRIIKLQSCVAELMPEALWTIIPTDTHTNSFVNYFIAPTSSVYNFTTLKITNHFKTEQELPDLKSLYLNIWQFCVIFIFTKKRLLAKRNIYMPFLLCPNQNEISNIQIDCTHFQIHETLKTLFHVKQSCNAND